MAFNFHWSDFSEEFIEQAKETLELAMNKNPCPDIVADRIEVTELNLGNIAPELNILEIGDLSQEKFRGILKLTYNGNAYIALRTQVQVNPVQVKSEIRIQARRGILAAHQPLIVPMSLCISHLSLCGIISLTVSPTSGITCVFKNDPLQGVEVNSTFDNLESVKNMLQLRIEDTLRNVFQNELPKLIHSFSNKLRPTASVISQVSSVSPTPTLPHDFLSPYNYQDLSEQCLETASLPDLGSPIRDPLDPQSFGYDNLHGHYSHYLPRRNYSYNQFPSLMGRFRSASKLGLLSSKFLSPDKGLCMRRSRPSRSKEQSPKLLQLNRTQLTDNVYHKVGRISVQADLGSALGLKSLLHDNHFKK